MLAMLKATSRVMLRYLAEKEDPEKATAYDLALRARTVARGEPRTEKHGAGRDALGQRAINDATRARSHRPC